MFFSVLDTGCTHGSKPFTVFGKKRQLALFFLPLHFNLSQSDGENGRKEEVGRHRENKEEDPRRILLIREQGNEKRGLRNGEQMIVYKAIAS